MKKNPVQFPEARTQTHRGRIMDRILRTDEVLDAVTSLEMFCELLSKVTDNLHYWKWAVVALHNALQGYMVLALRGSNITNVLTEDCRKELQKSLKSQGTLGPPLKLEYFLELYKAIQSDQMERPLDGQRFRPQGTQTESVGSLHNDRNNFIHFVPRNLWLPETDLLQVSKDCIDIIHFLAFECGSIIWDDDALGAKTRNLIEQAMVQLENLNTATMVRGSVERVDE
jgi:hypothetical protein